MTTFTYRSVAQQIVFGAGKLANIGAHLAYMPAGSILLCASPSSARAGTVARVEAALGDRLAGTFQDVQPHVPEASVAEALAAAERTGASAILGLGGGSALGTAKAVAHALLQQRGDRHEPPITVIAIPTTYAGSEMTPVYGVTRAAEGRKVTVTEPRITPAFVLYDPDLTLSLPPDLTAGTGINAFAHCIEGAYSTSRTPLTTASALAGAATIYEALPRCLADGRDRAAREAMLAGAYLGGATIAGAGMALHHGICHVLGGTAGVPHGVANCIMLPHVLRFNQEACAQELAAVARAIGLRTAGPSAPSAAEALVDAIAGLVHGLGMPRRLRDAGVAAADLPHLAALALQSSAVRANPRPVTASEVEDLLREAW